MKTLKDYKNFLNESSNIGYVVVGYNNNYKDYIFGGNTSVIKGLN